MKRLLVFAFIALLGVLPAKAVVPSTSVGNAAYTILSTDQRVITTVAFSAARIWTLPAVAATCIGQTCPANALVIYDQAGAITNTNTLTITPATGETINGSTSSLVVRGAYSQVTLVPVTGSGWFATITGPAGQALGTATNDSACTGCIGEVLSTTVAVASVVSLTSTTAADIATVALTAGDWDCSGVIHRNLAASTSVTQLKTSISATTATSGTLDTMTMVQWSTAANVMAANTSQVIGPIRISLAATTTYYLVAQDTFSVSTNGGYGQIRCRRAR